MLAPLLPRKVFGMAVCRIEQRAPKRSPPCLPKNRKTRRKAVARFAGCRCSFPPSRLPPPDPSTDRDSGGGLAVG
ncbi:hypothetical protein LIA77_01958 [Sarocladium implicatum]|nr:hypothetical protein LIA77_01958 [Sarocladium implicatum]